MNKKVSSIIIVFAAIVCAIIIGFVIKEKIEEKNRFATVEGEIIKITDEAIIFEEDVGGTVRVYKKMIPVVLDENDNRKDIRKLQVGQHIMIKYNGCINESLPAEIVGILEMIVKS